MQASQEAVRGQLADRLRFLYRSGDVDTVAVLLTATSLDDALGRLDALRRLTQEDTRLITDMQAAEAEVARTLGRLRTAEATLATEAERARAERRRLSAAVGDRRSVVADLAARRRLTAARLVALQAAAREADRRAAEVARRREQARAAAPVAAEPDPPAEDPGAAAPSPPPSTPEPAEAGGTFEVEATAYTLRGATATGVPTQRGVCAVDPAVIPLGTRFEVSGYGSCVAADTGGAIVGRRIDVWVATNAEASAWGRRVVTVTLG
jgi:cystine transport system substrate-binding protein